MMIASAKAELLRPGEAIEGSDSGSRTHGNFPGGWSVDWSSASSADESEEKTGLANMAALGHSLPSRTRSSTHGSDSPSSSYSSRRNPIRLNTNTVASSPDTDVAYVPPTPTYAISSSDPIPVGYVAHARDACIDVSYQWDSMRPPQSWGNGGDYGEEWSSMHRRFRNGLSKMIEWYEEHGTAVTKAAEMFVDPTEEEETDTVLILVTHGAGCNALLGALTNQPVLLDVGMASLTMAVRKERAKGAKERRRESEEATNPSSARKNGRRGSIDLGIAEDYEMTYTASTEHLRAGSNALGGSAISPRIGSNGSNTPYRRPATSISGDNFSIGEGASTFPSRTMTAGATSAGSSLGIGGLHRSVSGHSALRSMYTISTAPKVSSGLWRSGMWTKTGPSASSKDEATSDGGGESGGLPIFETENENRNARCEHAEGNVDTNGVTDGGTSLRKAGSSVAPEVTAEGPQSQRLQQHQQLQHQQETQVNDNTNGTSGTRSGAATPSELMKTPSHTPTRTTSHMGLWGGGVGGGGGGAASVKEMDAIMPKRRWTVVENAVG